MKRYQCDYCGEEVSQDYCSFDGCFGRQICSCGSQECEKYFQEAEQEMEAEARWEAEQDNYSRYR